VSPPPDSRRSSCCRAVRRACGIALLAVGLGALAPSARADRSEDLEHLRDAIDQSRERVAAYEREQRSLLEAVEALDRAAAALTREVVSPRKSATSITLSGVRSPASRRTKLWGR